MELVKWKQNELNETARNETGNHVLFISWVQSAQSVHLKKGYFYTCAFRQPNLV